MGPVSALPSPVRAPALAAGADEISHRIPAARAGLEVGDIIIAFDDAPVEGIDALHRVLDAGAIGRKSTIGVLRRDRRSLTLRVRPGELAG